MRRSLPLLVVTAVSLALPASVWSQDPPAAPPPAANPRLATPPPPPSNQNVRVDVTIALKADGKPLTKTLSMVTGDGKLSQGRAGIEIPVPNSGAPVVSYSYRGVSVNVDATPQILDGSRVLVRLKMTFSTVYKPETGQSSMPSFGNGQHEAWGIVFESGKPVIVTQSSDAETGRDYTIEVKATILK